MDAEMNRRDESLFHVTEQAFEAVMIRLPVHQAEGSDRGLMWRSGTGKP
jgi:hypothetical protein